jgi:peptide/nickel transport system permease protein
MFGAVMVLVFVAAALLAPIVSPHDPFHQDLRSRLMPPVWQSGGDLSHLLGTDALGRDMLSRILLGSRISLLVGLSTAVVGSTIGTLLGLLAGYKGGRLDSVIMRLADVQLAFPALVLAIAIMAILGPGLQNIVIVLSLTSWVLYARIVRGEALSLRSREFVVAARSVGVRETRILLRHVLPNVLAGVIVVATFSIAQAIIAEASLSFLGIGVPPPTPTWGNMLAEGRDYVSTAWWLATLPGIAIMFTLLGINLLGDRLRDVLDPRLTDV